MNAKDFDLDHVLGMAHSPIHNYIVPGLTSYLIGNPGPKGTMRVFVNSRHQTMDITPHSHRFDFMCWVLKGYVVNRIWLQDDDPADSDSFMVSKLRYEGQVGKYTKKRLGATALRYTDCVYHTGECYSMQHDEVHSITFSKDAVVLFFEGPHRTNTTTIAEPYVDGEVIETLKVESWMFVRKVDVDADAESN